MPKIAAVFLLHLLVMSCQTTENYVPDIPEHWPAPNIPASNLLTKARVRLGEKMFFDKNLSLDSTIACVSCHIPEKAFSDGLALSPGIMGRLGKRNAPSILNAAYLPLINKDGGVKSLDLQALVPIEDEREMGMSVLKLADRLAADPSYVKMAQLAYDKPPDAFVITRALASFVRTLYSSASPVDKFMEGDTNALSQDAKRGKALFESNRLNCTACHRGTMFTNHSFENNGLHDQYQDIGRALITLDSTDIGKFRVPSLRNVSITAPYMHDGSLNTLEEVIDHYEAIGQNPKKGQSKEIRAFSLNPQEKQDLLTFLDALTDQNYLDESGSLNGE